jgi:hypothetical protein
VVYFSWPEDNVHELWWDRAGWHSNDLSPATGAPGDPWSESGYAFEAQRTQHVVVDTADRILELVV